MSAVRPRFSRAAVLAGARACLALQAAIIPFGLVCGVVAQANGLSLAEATLMSGIVYAGSAQLLAFSHWAHPPAVLEAAFAAFVINLRLALMGPVLSPWLDRVRGWRLWTSLFFMADQNWALAVAQMQAGRWDAGYLFGSGVTMWVGWVLATAAGHLLGATMRPAPGHPLFFAALAVFVAFLVVMWRGRRDMLPWAVAAAVALLLSRALPGTSWYIVGGALAGQRRRGVARPVAAMSLDPWVLLTIAAMAAATFTTRAGGYLLFRAFDPPRLVRDMLRYIPGALFVSYVVPALASGGAQQWAGAAVTIAAMAWTGNLSLAILGGTGAAAAVWLLR